MLKINNFCGAVIEKSVVFQATDQTYSIADTRESFDALQYPSYCRVDRVVVKMVIFRQY